MNVRITLLRCEIARSSSSASRSPFAEGRSSRPFSRICYSVAPAPGTAVPSPPAAPADAEAGRPNFAALLFTFSALEWLWLSIDGHRRARFDWHAGPEPAASWLVP